MEHRAMWEESLFPSLSSLPGPLYRNCSPSSNSRELLLLFPSWSQSLPLCKWVNEMERGACLRVAWVPFLSILPRLPCLQWTRLPLVFTGAKSIPVGKRPALWSTMFNSTESIKSSTVGIGPSYAFQSSLVSSKAGSFFCSHGATDIWDREQKWTAWVGAEKAL